MQTTFPRQLANEILDGLAEDDPHAMRSRRDLRRINRIMGSAGILAAALDRAHRIPKRIIELGAGDGTLMLRLARRLSRHWPGAHVTLLDRQRVVGDGTRDAFGRLGWTVETLQADAAAWARQSQVEHWDIGIANLFIHHFDAPQIGLLFEALSRRTDLFVACEPRRARLPLAASRLVGLIGANAVTREDAVQSVRAGFCGRELSHLWSESAAAPADWLLDEGPARLFSHRFIAQRQSE
jgi:SAM-dependent methyltransferase